MDSRAIDKRIHTSGLLVTLLVFIAGTSFLWAQDEQAQRKKAKARFNEILAEGLRGTDKSAEFETALDKMLTAGLDKLAKEKFAPEKMKLAEKNLKKVAAEIVKGAPNKKVESPDVNAALKGLCPCFPWCPHPD